MKLRQRDLALSPSRACEVLGSSLDAWIRHYSLESHTTVPKANTFASPLVDLLRLNWHKTCWSPVDGNPHSRCPLCVARHAREPGIHHSGAAFTGSWHRSKHEHLQLDRPIPCGSAVMVWTPPQPKSPSSSTDGSCRSPGLLLGDSTASR